MAETKTTKAETKEKAQVAVAQPKDLVAKPELGIYGSSDNFNLACQMAKGLAQSTLVPATYHNSVPNCLIALEMSQRMGVSPFAVMQNMYVIQGRPSWSSSALIGMINASHRFDHELRFTETKDKNGRPYSCTAWTTRHGEKIEGIEITMDMAQAEGWLNKGGSKWKTIPQVMLRYRAASFFARMNCPEITMGLYTSDEVAENDFEPYNTDLYAEKVDEDVTANANKVEFNQGEGVVVNAD